ncbi:replicase [Strawberry mild yellow edge virus]|uniref:RNA replication protein n=1 Tax=Strawberry mild yellow edge-associated virus TaxID=12187 RepID=RDRP_SMYEA|nr:replicase [Strawberry mild yellow edge virus]P28897.1 RecName: Full=RNA replication protein; AltName: Full=150 kDa protein; AltName: Full=ORF1 protein; Includes: RecName: Full=RNA-directed RNA polymerase; Includes: RecName: Full=Helicase [Strawberry mild yellow edge virus]BAA02082.1 150K protein [Strawberry mild yellow edge virus]
MATRVASVFSSLTDVGIKAALQDEAYKRIKSNLREAEIINPYSVDARGAEALEELAIITNPHSIRLHTHAAAKSIENQMLNIVGHALPKEPVTFLFLKRGKLRYLSRGRIKDIFQNQEIEPRDVARYEHKTIVQKSLLLNTRVAYISDTLHFLRPRYIIDLFSQNVFLDVLYATVVLPVEASFKHPSQNPAIYTINYNYGGFQYLPGNHGGGAYSHEFEDLDWLKYGKFIYRWVDYRTDPISGKRVGTPKELVVTCQLVESLGANHLFIFKRGDLKTPRVRTFAKDKSVTFPDLFYPEEENANFPVDAELATKLFLYVKTLKTVTSQDVHGKLRQLLRSDELTRFSPMQLTHMVNYFMVVAHLDSCNDYSMLLGSSVWTQLTAPIQSKLRKLTEFFKGKSSFGKFCAALKWKTATYSLEVVDYVETRRDSFEPHPLDSLPDADDRDVNYDTDVSEDEADEKPAPKAPTSTPVPDTTPPASPAAPADAEYTQCWAAWDTVIRKHGFKGNQAQFDDDGNLITPIAEIKSLPKDSPRCAPELIKSLQEIARTPTLVEIDSKRSNAFGSDVKNGRIGMILKKQPNDWRLSFAAKCEHTSRKVHACVIHGAGGSGKSQRLQDWMRSLKKNSRECTVILPTAELRTDWVNKVPKQSLDTFKTWEKGLVQPPNRVVILDDYGKLPAGYPEALCANYPNIELLILTGDSRQSVHNEHNKQAATASLESNIEFWTQYCRFYVNATHRNVKRLANALGVYGERDEPLKVTCSSHVYDGWPVLAPGLLKAGNLAECGRRAFTYAGCQGLTAPRVQILLDNDTPLCSQRVMYTALSRAVNEIHFVNTGPSGDDFWTKLDCTPFLKTFLELSREIEIPEAKCQETAPAEATVKTHFPVENPNLVLEPYVEKMAEKFDRELYSKEYGYSNAIQTEDPVIQLFPHQQAKDDTLMWATIDQRLAITTKSENETEFALKKDIGDLLFINYHRAMKLPKNPIPFDKDLWQSCKNEVQKTYLSKDVGSIVNGVARQDPDFPINEIKLFLKSQWVKKVEKLGMVVKPGQTIASFAQAPVMLYGTMARYMRRMREVYQPSNIFINCEKTPADLDEWAKANWNFEGLAHSNDFTAFDQSQDGAMLQFEVIKAKFHNIPSDIINSYVELKTNAKVFLGVLKIMRLSGEGPTFDANTECSIAYHHTKYWVEPDVAQVYAGDDSAQDRTPVPRPSFNKIKDRLGLVSKPLTHRQVPGDFATFCGWIITPKGVIKDPLKLYASLQLAIRRGKSHEVALSYAHDAGLAYRLGDDLHSVLTFDEAHAHQCTVRDLVKLNKVEVLRPIWALD